MATLHEPPRCPTLAFELDRLPMQQRATGVVFGLPVAVALALGGAFFGACLGALLTAAVHQPGCGAVRAEVLPLGAPCGSVPRATLLARSTHMILHDGVRKGPAWVAYRVSAQSLGSEEVERRWAPDPWLAPADALEEADFEGAHEALALDRGHMAPLASLDGLAGAEALNLLSNIHPQTAALNRGPWKALEHHERALVRSLGEVYVLAGPWYGVRQEPLPGADEPHLVPSGFWKILYHRGPSGWCAEGYLFNQDSDHRTTYDALRTDVRILGLRARLTFPEQLETAGASCAPTSDAGTGGGSVQ